MCWCIRFNLPGHHSVSSPTWTIRGSSVAQQFEDRLRLIEAYEEAGFRGYHPAEHHGTRHGLAASPNLFLAAAAQRKSRIRLGPMVMLLNLCHPLRAFEEFCKLDHLSLGRLDLGIGRGGVPMESEFFGVTRDLAEDRYEAAALLMRMILIARDDAEARRIAAPAFARWHDTFVELWRRFDMPAPYRLSCDIDDTMAGGSCIIGSAARRQAALRRPRLGREPLSAQMPSSQSIRRAVRGRPDVVCSAGRPRPPARSGRRDRRRILCVFPVSMIKSDN
ncbi:LLM class flavin-dependent oxidoreductase [Roseomonas marmotae]|uniref:LLM class flavin-dependent oxidoreductase n=1 Tax=Roseomonas marmotae TaxID=2768161 RepID=A0ABS3K8D2_9PROT|nr:LLM class flavin-dependent oxidoreductase [Roseomonas marmotae]QTI78646.1 LLM class flavin-dependent oxidoreductase [Roseomonas marmotae]